MHSRLKHCQKRRGASRTSSASSSLKAARRLTSKSSAAPRAVLSAARQAAWFSGVGECLELQADLVVDVGEALGQGAAEALVPGGHEGAARAEQSRPHRGQPLHAQRVRRHQPEDAGLPAQQEHAPAHFERLDGQVSAQGVGADRERRPRGRAQGLAVDLLQRRQLGRGRAHDELAAVVELGPHQGLVEADEDRGRLAAALEARLD